ncbi:MAG: alditol oxidase [Mycobacteriales bacterium]
MADSRTNWAGNITYRAAALHEPSSVDELRAVVAGSGRLRALGTRHSFSDLADTPGAQVSVAGLPPEIEIDSAAGTVRAAAGLRYAEVAAYLDRHGFALHNLGSLPHISVAGACATGTHGSGVGNGCLSTAVAGLDLVTAAGDLIHTGRGDEGFDGMVVGLGALGIAVALTLELRPAFQMRQQVYEGLPLDVLDDHFTDVVASAYSVSLFTDWRAPRLTQIWLKQRLDEPEPGILGAPWFTAKPADGPRHPVPGFSPASCTEQLGVPGPWYQRLPHFRPEFTPSAGDELQTEYLIDHRDAVAAIRALDRVRDQIHPVLQICEIRTIAADDLWLSPAYQRESVSIHFTWVADTAAVLPVIGVVEGALAPYAPRPHWAKLFTLPAADLRPRYPRRPDFQALAKRLDPTAKFANEFTERYLSG